MKCENYDEDKAQCNYFESLIGSGEDPPTGMDESSGKCNPFEDSFDWFMVEHEDCDMFDMD